jgi:hypothetical protein
MVWETAAAAVSADVVVTGVRRLAVLISKRREDTLRVEAMLAVSASMGLLGLKGRWEEYMEPVERRLLAVERERVAGVDRSLLKSSEYRFVL